MEKQGLGYLTALGQKKTGVESSSLSAETTTRLRLLAMSCQTKIKVFEICCDSSSF